MITTEQIASRQKAIEDKIYQRHLTNDCQPVFDGVSNPIEYLNASSKILWILKEPYDDFENGKPKGGGFRMLNVMNDMRHKGKFSLTFRRIAQVSFGILNNAPTWNHICAQNISTLSEVFDKIAYINVKKTIGGKVSPDPVVRKAYQSDRDILMEQLTIINPDIIIFGGTYKAGIFDDFVFQTNKKGFIQNIRGAYFYQDGRIYIASLHPAARISSHTYCWDIINAVQNWQNQIHNLSL